MCVSFQIDPVKFIQDAWAALSQPLGYLRNPQSRIARLTDAMSGLRSQKADLTDRLTTCELGGATRTHQVRDWLSQFAALDAVVSQIQSDHKNGSFRWSINRRVSKTLSCISTLAAVAAAFDAIAFRLPPNGAQEVPADPPTTAVLALNSCLAKLQSHLQDDGGSRIIGIWGMGGVGKTTLLQRLNNELLCSSPPAFDHVIWAVASKDYKPGKLQRDIAQRLGLPLYKDRLRQSKEIFQHLKNRSFLLLLDDLWQPVLFSDIGIPQPLGGGPQKQKVVFTTRLEGVCGQMQARPRMKLECLKEEEAWLLFQEKVGEDTLGAHARIPQLARRVAKECDGLPLALVVIGSAMSTKRSPKEWQNAITLLQKSRPYEIQGMDDKILHKLKFSYDNLADEIIRKCFLVCSLWPEDFSISKVDLIECWMGHGLIDELKFDDINEAYDSGHALIGVLQAACLLEPGDDEGRDVKMHDVVRDLALWIASECGEKPSRFIVHAGIVASENSQRQVKRISLVRSDLSDTSGLPANCSELETLMMQESNSFKSIVAGFFQGTPALTYLDLSYTAIYDLPQEIGRLENLRYLNLSHTNISLLPGQIRYLQELRFLLLRDLESIIIPDGVLEKLVALSVIDMTHTWCSNWKQLSRLRGRLKGAGIVLESIEDMHQLAQLSNVPIWRLGLRKLLELNEPLQLLSPFQIGSRSIRANIQMLKIEFCENLELVSMEDEGTGTRNWCLSRLEEVELRGLPNLKEIVWRGVCPVEMLPSLTVLSISGCGKLSNTSWATRLPSLEVLTLHRCSEMELVVDDGNGSGEAFPSLRKLCLSELTSLRVFGVELMEFPSLEVLQVIKCPAMKRLPFGADIVGRKLKKIWGDGDWWEELEMEEDARAALQPRFEKMEARRSLINKI